MAQLVREEMVSTAAELDKLRLLQSIHRWQTTCSTESRTRLCLDTASLTALALAPTWMPIKQFKSKSRSRHITMENFDAMEEPSSGWPIMTLEERGQIKW